jgi:hypothetical protein
MSERDWTPSSTSESGLVEPDRDHIESVREAWTSYAAAAYPDEHLGMIPRREMRRAFYMGAWAMMINLAVATDLDESQADAQLTRLWEELNEFVDQVRSGRA